MSIFRPDTSNQQTSANVVDGKIEAGKEAAIEAEVRAARERAVVPLEIRMKQFRDMLAEKEVGRCNDWPPLFQLEFLAFLMTGVCVHEKLIFSFLLQVSAFSTWEKELHKIVFDSRYLLLTSKERKQVFEQYVKERAEEERREKRNKLREKRDQFKQLLEECKLHGK